MLGGEGNKNIYFWQNPTIKYTACNRFKVVSHVNYTVYTMVQWLLIANHNTGIVLRDDSLLSTIPQLARGGGEGVAAVCVANRLPHYTH